MLPDHIYIDKIRVFVAARMIGAGHVCVAVFCLHISETRSGGAWCGCICKHTQTCYSETETAE